MAPIVVVTGAGGFIGHALVAHFRETRRSFRAVRRARGPTQRRRPRSASSRDLGNSRGRELAALLADATAVVHLAGTRARDAARRSPIPRRRIRQPTWSRRSAWRALRCAPARRDSSSRARSRSTANRRRPVGPSTPTIRRRRSDAYARSKLDAERELGRICAGTSLAPVILRLPLVYGPGVGGNFRAARGRDRARTRAAARRGQQPAQRARRRQPGRGDRRGARRVARAARRAFRRR